MLRLPDSDEATVLVPGASYEGSKTSLPHWPSYLSSHLSSYSSLHVNAHLSTHVSSPELTCECTPGSHLNAHLTACMTLHLWPVVLFCIR